MKTQNRLWKLTYFDCQTCFSVTTGLVCSIAVPTEKKPSKRIGMDLNFVHFVSCIKMRKFQKSKQTAKTDLSWFSTCYSSTTTRLFWTSWVSIGNLYFLQEDSFRTFPVLIVWTESWYWDFPNSKIRIDFSPDSKSFFLGNRGWNSSFKSTSNIFYIVQNVLIERFSWTPSSKVSVIQNCKNCLNLWFSANYQTCLSVTTW